MAAASLPPIRSRSIANERHSLQEQHLLNSLESDVVRVRRDSKNFAVDSALIRYEQLTPAMSLRTAKKNAKRGVASSTVSDFDFIYKIGEGASAEVWAGRDRFGAPVAIKAIEKSNTSVDPRRVVQEKRIMEELSRRCTSGPSMFPPHTCFNYFVVAART